LQIENIQLETPALKGRNLNSLALQRQVASPPKNSIRPEGAGPNVQIEKMTPTAAANLALKHQAIQISPFQGGHRLDVEP
jgi:hypothetical protein